MEEIEELAISSASDPPLWWFRYVDDTHTKLKRSTVEEFTAHLNTVDEDIKFTTEGEVNGGLAFLDLNTERRVDGSLKVTVYRKPTHTDQYLNFESNHPLDHKLGVVRTLHHRATTVVSDSEDVKEEIRHVNQALGRCGYPRWALAPKKPKQPKPRETTSQGQKRSKSVPLPYIKGLSEELKRTFSSHGANVHFKPFNTIRQMLCAPKDPTKKEQVCGPIYLIPCRGHSGVDCDSSYIGEMERTLRTRFLEHCRPSSSSSEVSRHLHKDCPGHSISLEDVQILDRDTRWFERGVKEAIYIRRHEPDLNRDGGRHQLSHSWDNIIKSRVRVTRDFQQRK
ncbi:MAG: hypothetical protein MJA29_05100 [Candidatus Omnitrophica bacterium]|nr:hypothetical protein [Candidatus Omnitrophota bacterium]